jgi:anti-anti-sigma factor
MANANDSPWLLFTVTGELDLSRIDELDEMVGTAFDAARVNAIFDLSGVSFMDSSALRWFLKVQDRTDLSAGQLRLIAPANGHFQRLLSLTGLVGRFAVFPTRFEAEETAVEPANDIDDPGANLSDQQVVAGPTVLDGEIWEPDPVAGYTEWAGLGQWLTDKWRARRSRVIRA